MLPAEDANEEEKSGDDPSDGDHPYHPVFGAPAAIFGSNLHRAEPTDKKSSMIFCDIYLYNCKRKVLWLSNSLNGKTVEILLIWTYNIFSVLSCTFVLFENYLVDFGILLSFLRRLSFLKILF